MTFKKVPDICAMQPIKSIPPKALVPGITGYYAHGENMTFGLVELKAGSIVPLHHHVHEQTTFILEGQLDMVIGGQSCPLTAGMYHIIPSNTPHSAIARMDCKVIDVFSPVREDYKTTDAVKWQTDVATK
jgi:quercetin dioxygenase-like cupin family protein